VRQTGICKISRRDQAEAVYRNGFFCQFRQPTNVLDILKDPKSAVP
jgi:hypothetical protein